jgi:hypothetical protein
MLTEAADVERALLPAAFDLDLGFDLDRVLAKNKTKSKTNTKSSGQECPLHTLSPWRFARRTSSPL